MNTETGHQVHQVPQAIEEALGEHNRLDGLLKDLWERLRAAAQAVHALREEKRGMAGKISYLEQELETSKVMLQKRDQELRGLRAEHLQLVNLNGKNSLTDEEKEFLKLRIRDLIAKINSYI